MMEPTKYEEIPSGERLFLTPSDTPEYSGEGAVFFSLPKDNIPTMVTEYVNAMETERTNAWCKCEWIIHPDDENIDQTVCGGCHHALDYFYADVTEINTDAVVLSEAFCHAFNCGHDDCKPKPRRMRKGATDMTCPVHTKEGFLLGFFEWVFKDA